MENKSLFRFGLIILFLVILAIGYGYYINSGRSNQTNTTNLTNSTSNSIQTPTSQNTQSPRGESSVDNDSERNVRADCPYCTTGTVASHKQCPTCGNDKRIYDPATHSYIDCPDCTEDEYWMPCLNCGGDGYLDPGDPGYAR